MQETFCVLRNLIDQLHQSHGWNICLFDPFNLLRSMEGFSMMFGKELEHNLPYCVCIKTDMHMWRRCVYCKWRATTILTQTLAPFHGECVFGVGEYLHPVVAQGQLVAYISAYGYRSPGRERLHKALSSRLNIPFAHLESSYMLHLKPWPQQLDDIETMLSVIGQLLLYMLTQHTPGFVHKAQTLIIPQQHLPALQAKGYIDELYASNIKVRDIADFCHVSESYLQHLFKQVYDCGPYEMVMQRRLEVAAQLLSETTLPVYAIAARVGFSDANYLSTAFRRKYGITCLQHRKKYKVLSSSK